MNEGFGKDFYRKGSSVKSFGHSLNRRTLKTENLLSSSPSRKSALTKCGSLELGKRKTNKHKEFSRDTPWCASRLSRGHVPSVPWYVPSVTGTFCPFSIDLPKCPRCPWDVPSLSLGRLRGIPTAKFLYVIFLYRFFLSIWNSQEMFIMFMIKSRHKTRPGPFFKQFFGSAPQGWRPPRRPCTSTRLWFPNRCNSLAQWLRQLRFLSRFRGENLALQNCDCQSLAIGDCGDAGQ